MKAVESRFTAIPNAPDRVPEGRRFVRDFLHEVGAPEDDVFEILVAVDEALSNTCRHAAPPGTGVVVIRCFYSNGSFIVQVLDGGSGFDTRIISLDEPPDPLSQEGRGIFLMNQLMHQVHIASSPGGTVVTMERNLPAREVAEQAGALA